MEALQIFLRDTPAAKIDFLQTSIDKDGAVLSENGGRMWYRRPGLFRIEYDKPDAMTVVADGVRAWVYEPDLQQVIVQPAAAFAGESALLRVLSSGDIAELEENYVLSATLGGEWQWVTAEAKVENQAVRLVRLAFTDDNRLRRVELTDSFDGVARLDVIVLSRDDIAPGVFEFAPPPGVEIVQGQ